MQAECKLDQVGNAVIGQALALLILERLSVAAHRQKALPEMVNANDAKMLGLDWLAVAFHRCQELGDAAAVDLVDAEELRQRLMRAADLGEDLALRGGAG